jgi:hypothetical protein
VTDHVANDGERARIAEYCRKVEQHLTRVNGGHLVRIVGPGFELVRSWAEQGVPLSVVFRGIELKAERHAAGQSRRPLRIEFCAADVRDVYEGWRRAIGLHGRDAAAGAAGEEAASDAAASDAAVPEAARRPSLSRHLERAVERLVRAAGRIDLPDEFRAQLGELVERTTPLREAAHGARGEAREAVESQRAPVDAEMLAAARASTPPDVLEALHRDAEEDLAPFRGRLAGAQWARSVEVTVDRLLRDRYGLPMLML